MEKQAPNNRIRNWNIQNYIKTNYDKNTDEEMRKLCGLGNILEVASLILWATKSKTFRFGKENLIKYLEL